MVVFTSTEDNESCRLAIAQMATLRDQRPSNKEIVRDTDYCQLVKLVVKFVYIAMGFKTAVLIKRIVMFR